MMRHAIVLLALAGLGACVTNITPPPGERVAISVAPLSLGSVTDATYELSVVNAAGDTVWQKQLTSSAYGDGGGSVAYVGPCDSQSNPNKVRLVVVSLRDATHTLVEGVDFMNPAPAGSPLELPATCVANTDVPVTFDVTFARAAQQGFFDVAVTFDNIFCSAKLDCQDADGQPLKLLHDADGNRAATAVMAFACTAGAGADTHLYLSDLTVDCGNGDVTTLDPTLGPGTLARLGTSGLPNTHIFDALVSRGEEELGNWNKLYWNISLGLAAVTGCTLTAEGTASDGLFVGGATPADGTWPYLAWNGSLATCTHHGLDSGDGVVKTEYARPPGVAFANAFDGVSAAPFVFDVPITGALTAGSPGHYLDNSDAVSCNDYLHPTAPYVYSGSVGDGVYTIDPDGAATGYGPMDVFCDMTTDGGGWTEITACDAHDSLNGTLVAVQAGTSSGIDGATCSPYERDGAGDSSYHYTFDFPAGFTEFSLNGFQIKANSTSGNTSEIGATWFTMSDWSAATGSAAGDVGFGDGDAAGPVTSYAAQLPTSGVECQSCTISWPAGTQIFALGSTASRFRIAFGEGGGQIEGWYAWYAGTVRLR